MATQILKKFRRSGTPPTTILLLRTKTTSAQYVASRARDPTFEKLMDKYKHLLKVISIQDLILASTSTPPSVSLDFLQRLSQTLHLNRGPTSFLRNYPHIFHIFPQLHQPFCTLTPLAFQIAQHESQTLKDSLPLAVARLVNLLSMSLDKTLPLRAVFKVAREFGLPDDFEDSVISNNPHIFVLLPGNQPNTHYLKLKHHSIKDFCSVPAIDNWRLVKCCEDGDDDVRYGFRHRFPPGMRLTKNFKAKVKEWQRLPYIGPYEEVGFEERRRKRSKSRDGLMRMEKRAVGIVHEFLSLTVEKMVEVEKISHFRNWYGIDFNIRDLFLDHPGIFYLSTKGKRHTVFLREAYERGRLIEPNPVYDARRKLFDLVLMGRRGLDKGCDNLENVVDVGEQNELDE